MASMRQFDPELLEEVWFLELSLEYRWLYVWGRLYATQAGVWNKGKLFIYRHHYLKQDKIDWLDFLEKVNRNDDGEYKLRVSMLQNGNLFFIDHFVQQLGAYFKPTVNAHRGALKVLLANNIPLSEITGYEWNGLADAPFTWQKFVATDKAVLKLEPGVINRFTRETRNMTDESINMILESIRSSGKINFADIPVVSQAKKATPPAPPPAAVPEAPVPEAVPEAEVPPPPPAEEKPVNENEQLLTAFFGDKLIPVSFNSRKGEKHCLVTDVYKWNLEELKDQPSAFKRYTEEGFNLWKEFCDYVVASKMIPILNPQYFLSVSDMCCLLENGVRREHWNSIMPILAMRKLHYNDKLFFIMDTIAKNGGTQHNAATNGKQRASATGGSPAGQDFKKMKKH